MEQHLFQVKWYDVTHAMTANMIALLDVAERNAGWSAMIPKFHIAAERLAKRGSIEIDKKAKGCWLYTLKMIGAPERLSV